MYKQKKLNIEIKALNNTMKYLEIPSIIDDSVSFYVENGHELNKAIRKNYFENNEDEENYKKLQNLFKEKIKLDYDIHLFSGVDESINYLEDKCFTSTSTNFDIARDFTSSKVVDIYIPIGTEFTAIRVEYDDKTVYSNESEIIFPCNTRFERIQDKPSIVWEMNPNIQIEYLQLRS
jgi:hypothetical protein